MVTYTTYYKKCNENYNRKRKRLLRKDIPKANYYCTIKRKDLRKRKIITIKDQKGNICGPISLITAMEYIVRYVYPFTGIRFSELFVYYNTRRYYEGGDIIDWGIDELGHAIKSIIKYGCALRKDHSVRNYSVRKKPSDDTYMKAKLNTITKYGKIITSNRQQIIQIIKILLSHDIPVLGSISYQRHLPRTPDKNTYVRIKNGEYAKYFYLFNGYHSVLIIGFDDRLKSFIFQNSHGYHWGDRGCGYLPYNMIECNYVDDLWFILGVKVKNRIFEPFECPKLPDIKIIHNKLL